MSAMKQWREALAERLVRALAPERDKLLFLRLFEDFRHNQAFGKYEERMLEGVLGLGETTVADTMTPKINVDALDDDDDWDTIFKKIAETNHSRYPVINHERDEVIGTLISKDLLASPRAELLQRRVTDFVRRPLFVPEKTRLNNMLRGFTSSRRHMALVVDEFGSFVGLITLEDVLEEIVGEIEDEHDEEEDTGIERIKENTYLVNPMLSIGEICDRLKIKLSGNGADTLGGFVVRHFGRIPRRGDNIEMDGYEITVNKVSTRRVTEVRIRIAE